MSPQNNEARVALIGYGLAGSVFHAPLIDSVDSLKLSAIVTANPDRIAQAQKNYPHARILKSVEEIWNARDQFDVVVVASPNRYHFPHAKDALEANLHVVVDKPISTTADECRDLINVSKKQQKILTVFQNRRWDNDVLTVAKLIDNGSLGKITRLESRFERYRPEPKPNSWRELGDKSDAGGLLFDLGSHLIDQACFLFGDPVSVYCELAVRRPSVQVDDDVFVALKFESGVIAHLWASAVARLKGPRFRVLGLTGAYEKFGLDPQEDRLRAGWSPTKSDFGNESDDLWGRLSTQSGGLNFDGKVQTLTGAYLDFYKQLGQAIREQADVPVKATDALRTMQIIEAAFKSASSGNTCRLEVSKV